MEKQVHKIAKRFYNHDGKWIGPEDYKVVISGVEYDWNDLAKQYGIETPNQPNAPIKPKKQKQINIDEEEKGYGDMEQAHSSTSAEEHGDGDSESTE